MATAQLDIITDISGDEQKGRFETVTREARVTGLNASAADTLLVQMLAATNLPAAGSTITMSGSTLYLESRKPKLLTGNTTIGIVTLHYQRREGAASDPGGTTPTLTGGSALQQVTTQTYLDGNKLPTVEHTWADDDEDNPNKLAPPQGGELTVMLPIATVSGEFVTTEADPGSVAIAWTGYLNSDSWQGRPPRTWMCMGVDWELVDSTTTPDTYRFRFMFEYNEKTWDDTTTIIFIDSRTGKPPGDIIIPSNTEPGYQVVGYYKQRNYSNTF